MRSEDVQALEPRQVQTGPLGLELWVHPGPDFTDRTALEAEIAEHRRDPWPDGLAPIGYRDSGPTGPLVLGLPSIPTRVTRLDLVLDRLARARTRMSPPLARWILQRVTPHALRSEATGRPFPFEEPGALLVHPSGAIGLMGPAGPVGRALLGAPVGSLALTPVERLKLLLGRLLSGNTQAEGTWRELGLVEPPSDLRAAWASGDLDSFTRALAPSDPAVPQRFAEVLHTYIPDADRSFQWLLRGPVAVNGFRPPSPPQGSPLPRPIRPRSEPGGDGPPAPRPASRATSKARGGPTPFDPVQGASAGFARPLTPEDRASRPPRRWLAAALALLIPLTAAAGVWMLHSGTLQRWTGDLDMPSDKVPLQVAPDRSGTEPGGPDRASSILPAGSEAESSDPADTQALQLVSIMSQPSGATVELNGEKLGVTPLVTSRRLDAASYRVRLVKEGYEPWVQRMTVDRDQGGLSVMAELVRR